MNALDRTGWQLIAQHRPLVLVLHVDLTLLATLRTSTVDRGLIILLDALHDTGVQIVVLSDQPADALVRLSAAVDHVWWWSGDMRSADRVQWALRMVRRRIDGRVIAISDMPDGPLFSCLEPDDRTLVVGGPTVLPLLGSQVLRGAVALRAMLWWLVESRSRDVLRGPV